LTDIFTEVEEGVRQDRIATLWRRWRFAVFGGVGLFIGGVALNEFVIQPGAERARAERALSLETAIGHFEEGRYAEAEAGFRAILESGSKMSPLAANYLAGVVWEGGGDAEEAATILAGVGSIEGDVFSRLAILKAAYLRADVMSLSELESSLGALTGDEGPLGALARELVAAKLYQAGEYERARTEFNRLRFDAAAPAGTISRAQMALTIIPQAADTPDIAPPAEPEEAAPEETGE
jgi:hypothetical protein